MYSAWIAAWVNGAVVAAVWFIQELYVDARFEAGGLTTPVVLSTVVSALGIAAILALPARFGLRLARCSRLGAMSIAAITVISVGAIYLLWRVPILTITILAPGVTRSSEPNEVLVWVLALAPIIVPGVVCYAAGRVARYNSRAA